MIASFGDRATEDFYHARSSRHARTIPTGIHSVARRKLDMIEFAHELRDLASPPGNRLHPLKGTLQGYHSIRVNDQWRVVFRWQAGAAHEVSLSDYH